MGDDSTPEDEAAPFNRYLEAGTNLENEAIINLYGALPDWLPEPIEPRIRQALATLHNAGQSNDRVVHLVAQARADCLKIPATAKDTADFIKSVYELAHVQVALTLEKSKAIEMLAGSRAASDYRRAKAGHDAQFGTSQERRDRDSEIRALAADLKTRNSALSANAIAEKIGKQRGLSARQVKRILGGIPPTPSK